MNWDKITKIQGLKNVTILGLANISGNAISAVFWLFLANFIGAEKYGEIGYLISIAGITMSISIWGSEKALMVYTAKGLNIQPAIYIISIITSGISALILYVVFESIGMSIYLVGAVIYNLAVAEFLGRKQFKNYSKHFLMQKILFVGLALGLFYVMGPHGVLLGFGISCLPFAHRIIKTLKENKIDFKIIKEKSGFILNNYIIDLSAQFGGQIDKLLIGPIFGFILLGNYYLGIQVLNILAIIPEVVGQYTIPQDASGKSTKRIKILTVSVSGLLALIGIFIIPIFLPTLFPEYSESLDLIPIISMAIIPITISSMYISKFLGNEKSRFVVISYLIVITIIVSGIIIFGDKIGIVGLAIIFVSAESAKAIFLFIVNHIIEKNGLSTKN